MVSGKQSGWWLAPALLLAGCGEPARQAEPDNAAPRPTAATFAPEALPEAQRLGLALTAANSKAQPNLPARLLKIGSEWALIIPLKGEECHACVGKLEIHYLKIGENSFEQTGAWPDLIPGGTFGAPPEWTIRDDLMPYPVIAATGGGTWQGYTCATTTLAGLTPGKPTTLATVPIDYDNSGAVEGGGSDATRTISGKITPVTRGQSFNATYSGTEKGVTHYRIDATGKAAAPDGYEAPTC